jgi:hypothetical protein
MEPCSGDDNGLATSPLKARIKVEDAEVRRLRPGRPADMVKLVELLCGWPLDPKPTDMDLLKEVLQGTNRVTFEQFNEMLLILNQERVSRHFFRFFFQPKGHEGHPADFNRLREGVALFRGMAMLCFGNFRFAYKRLSSLSERVFDSVVGRYCKLTRSQMRCRFLDRPPKAIRIRPVPRAKTWYVGYLTERKLEQDNISYLALLVKSRQVPLNIVRKFVHIQKQEEELGRLGFEDPVRARHELPKERWREATNNTRARVTKIIRQVVEKARSARLDTRKWLPLRAELFSSLQDKRNDLLDTRSQAGRNTAAYLTWDFMDVYVATSMRERWEYESTHKLLEDIFRGDHRLRRLKVRYFDPTQSFSTNRIDKGLVEALMLKRATCTLYLAQETDTLGKDSELASTLAQGKPVVAFVPEIENVEKYARDIAGRPLDFLLKRWLLLDAEEIFTEPDCMQDLGKLVPSKRGLGSQRRDTLGWLDGLFDSLREACAQRTFILFEPEDAKLKSTLGDDYAQMCRALAIAEKHYFDKRAGTLREGHPLAIQVHLETGVANGVLVVRNVKQCAELIYRLLIYDYDFRIRRNQGMTELIETISGCPYRVVTEDAKLRNSFWNFYLTRSPR